MIKNDNTSGPYTCNEYREEMILLGLRRRLMENGLNDTERQRLRDEINKIEKEMGLN